MNSCSPPTTLEISFSPVLKLDEYNRGFILIMPQIKLYSLKISLYCVSQIRGSKRYKPCDPQLEGNLAVTAEPRDSQGLNKWSEHDDVIAQYRALNALKTLEDCLSP